MEKLYDMNGPWANEPDRMEFEFAGFPCLIIRHMMLGHLCGYVGVPKGHPWYGVDYMDLSYDHDIDVHGGLTFGSYGDSEEVSENHYYKPSHYKGNHLYWIGFDCNHYGDLAPYMYELELLIGNYRDIDYVRREVQKLALQAKEALSD